MARSARSNSKVSISRAAKGRHAPKSRIPKPRPGKRKSAPSSAPVDRNAQLIRVLLILADLCRLDGIDIYELAEKYDATPRTIRRDFDALEAAGFELVGEPDAAGKRRRWRIASDRYRRRLEQLLDVNHYFALRVAMEQQGPLHQRSDLYAQLEDLSDKIEKVLGMRERKTLETINRCLHTYDKFAYRDAAPEVLWQLIRAIDGHRLCKVTYRAIRDDGKDRTYDLLPLKVFVYNRALYLHAFVPFYDNVIVLNLQRLRKLEVLETKCAPPESYDPEQLESSAFGVFIGKPPVRYRIRFDAAVAPYIRERMWHATQEIRELRARGLELSFACSPSPEVEAWIASWRGSAEVMEPSELRKQMAALGADLKKKYAGS
jgi:proteasome accessory factor B